MSPRRPWVRPWLWRPTHDADFLVCCAALGACNPPLPPSPLLQDDLRRAVEEKVAALDLLASAERRLVEAQDADVDCNGTGGPTAVSPAVASASAAAAPLPSLHQLLSGRRLSGMGGGGGGDIERSFTPRSRSARMASYLGAKLGKVARLLSGG